MLRLPKEISCKHRVASCIQALRLGRSALSYLTESVWRVVDLCSTALLVTTAIMWICILAAASRFTISLRWAGAAGVGATRWPIGHSTPAELQPIGRAAWVSRLK